MPTIQQVVDYCLDKVGRPYCSWEGGAQWRLTDFAPHPGFPRGCSDCSGLFWCALHHLGGPSDFPANTDLIAEYCRRHGTQVNLNEAYTDFGILLIKDAWDRDYIGHIALTIGGGRTVEEANHAQGCIIGSAFGRGFDFAARIPGIDYSGGGAVDPTPLPPPVIIPEDEVNFPVLLLNPDNPDTPHPKMMLDIKGHRIMLGPDNTDRGKKVRVKWNLQSVESKDCNTYIPNHSTDPNDHWAGFQGLPPNSIAPVDLKEVRRAPDHKSLDFEMILLGGLAKTGTLYLP